MFTAFVTSKVHHVTMAIEGGLFNTQAFLLRKLTTTRKSPSDREDDSQEDSEDPGKHDGKDHGKDNGRDGGKDNVGSFSHSESASHIVIADHSSILALAPREVEMPRDRPPLVT
jgi:hypothetical protein